jgi:hypothetical protein
MNNKEVQSILKLTLEEEIPSSQVNLWPAVKADLVAGKHPHYQQGDTMNTLHPRRIPRFALALSLVLALLVVMFVTPQGRSFAQSVLDLFTRADGTSVPLEDSQIVPFESDEISPTVAPPAPLISVAEAEAQVGFEVAEIPYVPEGFDYLGVRLYGKNVTIDYMTEGYGHLIIMQSQEGFYQSEWDNVPAEAVVPVKIGELDGEFTQGIFVVYPGEDAATWAPDASIMRLRWINNGVWFEIAVHGDAVGYFDQAELIKLAESLAIQP